MAYNTSDVINVPAKPKHQLHELVLHQHKLIKTVVTENKISHLENKDRSSTKSTCVKEPVVVNVQLVKRPVPATSSEKGAGGRQAKSRQCTKPQHNECGDDVPPMESSVQSQTNRKRPISVEDPMLEQITAQQPMMSYNIRNDQLDHPQKIVFINSGTAKSIVGGPLLVRADHVQKKNSASGRPTTNFPIFRLSTNVNNVSTEYSHPVTPVTSLSNVTSQAPIYVIQRSIAQTVVGGVPSGTGDGDSHPRHAHASQSTFGTINNSHLQNVLPAATTHLQHLHHGSAAGRCHSGTVSSTNPLNHNVRTRDGSLGGGISRESSIRSAVPFPSLKKVVGPLAPSMKFGQISLVNKQSSLVTETTTRSSFNQSCIDIGDGRNSTNNTINRCSTPTNNMVYLSQTQSSSTCTVLQKPMITLNLTDKSTKTGIKHSPGPSYRISVESPSVQCQDLQGDEGEHINVHKATLLPGNSIE